MLKPILIAAAIFAAAATQAAPPPKPRLIVAISVDQYSSEVFRRYRATYTAGLRTLANGIAYPTGYQSHAATETCPGHSTILTGRHPAGTGIVANSWLDRKTGMSVYCVAVPGSAEKTARGPQNMRVTTLGDWIKAAQPRARSFAVSGKDRAAITMGGQHADGIYWWADGMGFTTSSHAGPATPRIVQPAEAFNAKLMNSWKVTPPQLWPAPSPACAALSKRQQFGQLELSGNLPPDMAKGVTEGDDFVQSKRFNEAMRASPTFDATIADFAIELIAREKLGRSRATDVLAIGLSATDYVGHRLGNGGPEMCVHQAALDATIGRLLDRLQALHIPFIVMLTADHGATDASERYLDEGGHGYRIDDTSLMSRLNDALEAQFGIARPPLNTEDSQQLYVIGDSAEPARERVLESAVRWLKERPEVKAVFTRAEIEGATVPPGTPPDRLTMLQRFRESYDAERSGDIAVAYAERSSFGVPSKVGDTVAGHGTPWDHDRRVPILFWWPGVSAEPRDQPIETVDIAPTLAGIAGIAPPVPVDGHCRDLGGNCRK